MKNGCWKSWVKGKWKLGWVIVERMCERKERKEKRSVCEWNGMKNLGGENEKKVGVVVKEMWSGGDWNGVIGKWEKWMKMWSKG